MRFILVMFCILCVTMVTKSTMNVGTIWFKQNNGNFLRKLPILRQKISRINENPSIYPVMKPEEKVRNLFPFWWNDFRKWNKFIKIKKCKYFIEHIIFYNFKNQFLIAGYFKFSHFFLILFL